MRFGPVSERLLRWEELRARGQHVSPEELCQDCPELLEEVRFRIEALEALYRLPVGSLTLVSTLRRPAGPPGAEAEPPQVAGYELLGELGRGGMGVVYKAWQTGLRRVVALKMILAGPYAGSDERARFAREAEAAARLQHPNIVPIYEVGESQGRPYLALEYVDGGSLAQRLQGSPLPAREAAGLVEALARAVHHAHGRGIVHRDLKPANVLMAADGTPRVGDFGLARILAGGDGAQTQSGDVMGTPSYMAPEQAAGRGKEAGPAADVYALGAILYECLTGRPPFKGESALETLRQVIADDPVPLTRLQPKVPRDLDTICLKCLQKEPQQRYASAAALADDLRRFQGGEPVAARPAGRGERAWKWARRRPAAAALLAVSALAAAALAGVIGTAGAVVYGKNQALQVANAGLTDERNRAREAEARAVEERQKARDALEKVDAALFDGILRPIGDGRGISADAERRALADLARLPDDEVRLRFLRRGLEQPETAGQLARRSEAVIEAVAGKEASRRQAARELLSGLLDDDRTDPRVRLACVHLGLALGSDESDFVRQMARALLEGLGTATGKDVGRLAPALHQLGSKLPAAEAPRFRSAAGQRLLDVIASTDDPADLSLWGRAVAGLPSGADKEGGADLCARAAARLLDAAAGTEDAHALSSLGEALAGLAPGMGAEGARVCARAAARLLDATERATDSYSFSPLAQALWYLSSGMDKEGAKVTAPGLLDAMSRTDDAGALASLGEGVAELAARVDEEEAARLCARAATKLLDAVARTRDPLHLTGLAQALAALAARMDAEGAAAGAPRLVDAMTRTDDPGALSSLGEAVAALVGRMEEAGGAKVCARAVARLLDALAGIKDTSYLYTLAQALTRLAAGMDAEGARASAPALLDVMARADDAPTLSDLGEAMTVLVARMDAEGAARVSAQAAPRLLDALARTSEPHPLARCETFFVELARRMHRRDLHALLKGRTLPGPAAERLCRALEPLAGKRLPRIEDAVNWLGEAEPPGPAKP
jgi:hypothetical protein